MVMISVNIIQALPTLVFLVKNVQEWYLNLLVNLLLCYIIIKS